MPNQPDLVGQSFGRLVVVEKGPLRGTRRTWRCVCTCGNETFPRTSDLRAGGVASCGCLLAGPTAANTRHGHSSRQLGPSRTYRSWATMLNRCTNPETPNFDDYGGRGITVCARWYVFENFLEDMSERPPARSIDRIDVNGNYEPGNCRWATDVEQARNRRPRKGSISAVDGVAA